MALLPIALILLITTLLLFFILKDFGMVTRRQKILGAVVLLALAGGIGIYSYQKSQSDKQNFLLQMAFLRGETLQCGDQEVSAKTFNLVSGTLSLIGKKNTEFHNLIFSLANCERKASKQDSQALEEQLEKD